MIFSHGVGRSLSSVVALVNSGPSCGGTEDLPDAASLQTFVTTFEIDEDRREQFEDVAAVHMLRDRLRQAFNGSGPAGVASIVNDLLAESSMHPRLTDHDGDGWHFHYFTAEATLAEHLAIDGCMALAQLVVAGETKRLRGCAAADCDAVLVDLSRNRSKRYCDARSCGNRLNVAAYRERKRLDGIALGSG